LIGDEVLEILEREGPLTGGELLSRRDWDRFLLWKTCLLHDSLSICRVGERYLRLDQHLPGYARLSPSILREFLTYTVIGTDKAEALRKAERLRGEIRRIGELKTEIARAAVEKAHRAAIGGPIDGHRLCFILAGDIAYGMAHSEPRPEISTGKMVRGSDLDLVVVLDDSVPETVKEQLDKEIYREKFRLLIDPDMNEEIDYVVKYKAKVEEQLKFDTFKRMVACKILMEGFFLGGDRGFFDELKLLLHSSGAEERLAAMEAKAIEDREEAEKLLISADAIDAELPGLFYSAQESEEFE
jgi:hypothetical protein